MIRHYTRLRIDNILMSGMLLASEESGKPVEDWLGQLRILRQLPAHQAALKETEWLIAQVRQTADEESLMTLISSIPKSGLPN